MKQLYFLLTLLFFLSPGTVVRAQDTVLVKKDTLAAVPTEVKPQVATLKKLLDDNRFLNSKGIPVSLAQVIKKRTGNNDLFYLLAAVVLILGIAKTVYSRYFSNMFRVFFNSSLRQSQLTDQLVQDKFPSLVFNIFFIIVSGLFVYLLIQYFKNASAVPDWPLLGVCIAAFAVIYFVKFITLRFTGWMTGYRQEADIYTFIVFLINKIIAICLLPMIIIIAFSKKELVSAFVLISFMIIGTMLLMRFFRSYGLLQHRLKVGRFHFFLYIFSLEILPLLLIYKAALFFFSIKL